MKNLLLVAVCCVSLVQSAFAIDPPKDIAVGDWSEAVADNRGYSVRGRLVLCEKPRNDTQRETPLYIELQDANDFVGHGMRLYCDMGKHDFRPEYKGGLNCDLKDKEGTLIQSQGFPFGGAVPKSEWISIPTDGTVRLRATPFGIRRENALSICPHLNRLWTINDDDPKEYFLSGTFTVESPELASVEMEHVWSGTLNLPPLRIVGRHRANKVSQ